MKKTLILLLLMVITANAENTLWRSEVSCYPMIPDKDFGRIMILKKCSNPDKAFNQWMKDNQPNWTIDDFTRIEEETWIVFLRHI